MKAHEASAERKNKKIRDEVPLFAEQLATFTPQLEYWNWRRNQAEAAERVGYVITGSKGLTLLRVIELRRVARGLVGEEAYEKLADKCKRMYPSTGWEYHYTFWCKVLTGERIVFAIEKVEDRKPGEPATRCTDWYEQAFMTKEEFYARFPYADAPVHDHGDGGRADYEAFIQLLKARRVQCPND